MKKLVLGVIALSISVFGFSSMAAAHMGDSHESQADLKPAVSLEVTKDEIGGFNVHIISENFVWAPERASMEHVDGEGHAHIYLDGEKLGRVYAPWYHLNTSKLGLKPGTYELMVDLNGNDHGVYTVDGENVQATASFEVTEEPMTMNSMPLGLTTMQLIVGAVALVVFGAGGFVLGRTLKSRK